MDISQRLLSLLCRIRAVCRIREIRTACILCAVCFHWSSLAAVEKQMVAQQPQIVVAQPSFSIGDVVSGDLAAVRFDIRNTGNDVLRIHNVGLGCGCLAEGRTWSKEIAAGADGNIEMTIDTGSLKNVSGPLNIPITVFSNDPEKPQLRLWITGNVEVLVHVRPQMQATFAPIITSTTLAHTSSPPRSQSPQQKIISITKQQDVDFKLSLAKNTQGGFRAELVEVQTDIKWELRVYAQGPFVYGNNTAEFLVNSTLPRLQPLKITASIYRAAPVRAVPAQIRLPQSMLSTAVKRIVMFRQAQTTGYTLQSVSCNMESVTWDTPQVMNAGITRINVYFPAGVVIAKDATLRSEWVHATREKIVVHCAIVGK